MFGRGLRTLSIASVILVTGAFALVFLYAPNDADQGFVQKIFYLHVPLAIVALGGFGSILGTLMAALLVGVVQSVTAAYLPPAFKDAFVFASYILIGLFRPQGLFGRF